MDAFTSRSLASSWFTRPVTRFTKTRMYESANEWRLTVVYEGFPSAEVGNSYPQPPPSLLSSDKIDRGKYRRKYQKASASKVRDHTSRTKLKDRYSTLSLDRNSRTPSSGHDSSIPDLQVNARFEELPQQLLQLTEQAWPVLQIIKKHFSQAVD